MTVRGWGNLVASEEQDAISGAAGVPKEVFFEPGDYVSAGQVLAIVDAGSLEMEIKKLEFQVEQKRIGAVREFGVSPDQVADVDPEAALVVRSPISGRITGVDRQGGQQLVRHYMPGCGQLYPQNPTASAKTTVR